ncbi:MAG: hypothetical protein PHU53_05015 [Thermoplasmata archaeon]|nr:hypothetical protein [Thermoplasmata archaeon]
MAKDIWNYGMLETEFTASDLPSYDDYMSLIENKLTEKETVEPLFSGKIAGRNEYWTFVRHRLDPKNIEELCISKIPEVKTYSHCYSFKRFRGETMSNIFGGKHRFIGLASLPEAEEFDESELKDLMKMIEANTPFHVAWMSKTHRRDSMNAYFFLTGNVPPDEIEAHKKSIDSHIKAEKSEILLIQKFGHHKSHKRSLKEKEDAIKKFMPEEYMDHEWLQEYEYFHWSR